MTDPLSRAPGAVITASTASAASTSTGAAALTTTCDLIFDWARGSALRPIRLGLACCAVEMTAVLDPRYDRARLGLPAAAPPPATAPAASDVLIVAGTVSEKLAPLLRRLWDQMPHPKWAIAMGACAACGGPFPTYAVTQGIDRVIPVDVYVPGCPPPPEALLLALLHLEQKIARQRRLGELRPGERR
ncbi:MAG TPA: NADH-quinone oxidoreductase subunit NuoB [Thermoanaerobaculia bacterium]|jgi:NADH-quinone oxidoreductase subunit B|nr:NADH-quinone oxidoreductase subunit NuoB [Thermoanaerobaculia bacterium]